MLLGDLECWWWLRCMQPAGFIASAALFAVFWYVLQIRHHLVRLLPHLLHRAHLRPHPHQVSLGLAVLAELALWLLSAVGGCIRRHASCWPGTLIMLERHATCWLYQISCPLCYECWYVLQVRHHLVRLLLHLLHRAHLRPHPHQVSLGLAVLAEVACGCYLQLVVA